MKTDSSLNAEKTVHVREMIAQKKRTRSIKNATEKSIPIFLLLIATISILTTAGIIYTLLSETITFFNIVPIVDFFTGTVLKPLSQNPEFGVLPLLTGTIFSSIIRSEERRVGRDTNVYEAMVD